MTSALPIAQPTTEVHAEVVEADECRRLAHQIEVGLLARERLERASGLSASDQADLGRLVDEGRDAWSVLVTANLRLVTLAARRLRAPASQLRDLVQSGSVGLVQAVMRWDHRRGAAFSTYAMYWIRQTMLVGYTQHAQKIRLPTTWTARLGQISRTRAELAQRHGREPSLAEIAGAVDMRIEDLKAALALSEHPAVIDHDRLWFAQRGDPISPDEETARSMLSEHVAQAMRLLTERERTFVRLRFGFDDGVALSLDDVARQVGLHRERVRRVVNRALDKIRASSHAAELQGFLT
jgi:RNA polymerase sigma factor (sigma-70 family)